SPFTYAWHEHAETISGSTGILPGSYADTAAETAARGGVDIGEDRADRNAQRGGAAVLGEGDIRFTAVGSVGGVRTAGDPECQGAGDDGATAVAAQGAGGAGETADGLGVALGGEQLGLDPVGDDEATGEGGRLSGFADGCADHRVGGAGDIQGGAVGAADRGLIHSGAHGAFVQLDHR